MGLLKMRADMEPIAFKSTRNIRLTNRDGTEDEIPGITSTHFINSEGIDKKTLLEDIKEFKSISKALKKQGKDWRRFTTGINSRLPTLDERKSLKIGLYDPVIETSGLNIDCNRIDLMKPIELTKSVFPGHLWGLVFYFHQNEH